MGAGGRKVGGDVKERFNLPMKVDMERTKKLYGWLCQTL